MINGPGHALECTTLLQILGDCHRLEQTALAAPTAQQRRSALGYLLYHLLRGAGRLHELPAAGAVSEAPEMRLFDTGRAVRGWDAILRLHAERAAAGGESLRVGMMHRVAIAHWGLGAEATDLVVRHGALLRIESGLSWRTDAQGRMTALRIYPARTAHAAAWTGTALPDTTQAAALFEPVIARVRHAFAATAVQPAVA